MVATRAWLNTPGRHVSKQRLLEGKPLPRQPYMGMLHEANVRLLFRDISRTANPRQAIERPDRYDRHIRPWEAATLTSNGFSRLSSDVGVTRKGNEKRISVHGKKA